jgi:hypothetical protein
MPYLRTVAGPAAANAANAVKAMRMTLENIFDIENECKGLVA